MTGQHKDTDAAGRRPGRLSLGWRAAAAASLLAGVLGLGVGVLAAPAGAAGSSWSQTASAAFPNTPNDGGAISCPSPTFCMGVGDAFNVSADNWQAAAQSFNGTTWTPLTAVTANPTTQSYLYAVSCTSATFCMAGGYYYTGAYYAPMTESWNGTVWTLVATPNPFSNTSEIYGVSCTSPTTCVATGFARNGPLDTTLVETWNGTIWTVQTSPSPGTNNNDLQKVSCVGTFCASVGSYSSQIQTNQLLVTSSDGGVTWTQRSGTTRPNADDQYLYGVSCLSASWCMAVGIAYIGGQNHSLTETWNGSSWTLVPSEDVATTPGTPRYTELYSVDCVSQNSCVAVGETGIGNADPILIEGYNGTAFSIVPSPSSLTNSDAYLEDVSCPTSSRCVAYGSSYGFSSSRAIGLTGPPPAAVGYWEAGSDGGVFSFGAATFHGSIPGLGIHINNIVGIVASPSGGGYLLIGSDGGVFALGDATFEGSVPGAGVHVNNIVGLASTPDGKGYWVVGSNGGVYAFGDAMYRGSLPGLGVNVSDVTGIAAAPGGNGYWVTEGNGSIFAFGAPYQGASGASHVIGVAPTSANNGGGYWTTTTAGAVGAFSAPDVGGLVTSGVSVNNIVGISPTFGGGGFWLVGSDGGIFGFGDASYLGSVPGLGIHISNVVGLSAT